MKAIPPFRAMAFSPFRLSFVPFLGCLAFACAVEQPTTNARSEALLENSSPTAGEAGAGSVPIISCDASAKGQTPGSCEPTDENSVCQTCVKRTCCAEQAACNASNPDASCAFGSTLFQGRPIVGEIGCVLECWAHKSEAISFAASAREFETCTRMCGASECEREAVGPEAEELAACIIGLDGSGDNCSKECGLAP